MIKATATTNNMDDFLNNERQRQQGKLARRNSLKQTGFFFDRKG